MASNCAGSGAWQVDPASPRVIRSVSTPADSIRWPLLEGSHSLANREWHDKYSGRSGSLAVSCRSGGTGAHTAPWLPSFKDPELQKPLQDWMKTKMEWTDQRMADFVRRARELAARPLEAIDQFIEALR
jgi:hypothetical protein